MNKNNRLLVTGGGGLVGSAINQISEKFPQFDFIFTNHNDHDLTKELVVKKLFNYIKPNYVIHTAAFVGGIGRNLASPAQQYYQNILMNSFVIHYAYLSDVKKLISFSSVCAFPDNVPLMNEEILNNKDMFKYRIARIII